MKSLLRYVQNLADSTDPEHALNIIASSGFKVKGRSPRVKALLEARRGMLSGSVILIARGAGKRDFHEWQMSHNGSHWNHLSSTVRAKTEVTELTPLATMYFRHRVITKDGPLNWNQPVKIIVL